MLQYLCIVHHAKLYCLSCIEGTLAAVERVVERVVEREFTEAVADARGRGHCRLAAVRLGKARIVHEGSPACR